MNVETINLIVQSVSAGTVCVTLIYLVKQTSIANKTNMLDAFQHTQDNVNQFNDTISQSSDLAAIIIKGRKSFASLTDEEKLRFEHIYGRLLNILETWYTLLQATRFSGTFEKAQLQNIKAVVKFYFSYKGVLEFWEGYKGLYIREIDLLIKENAIVSAPSDKKAAAVIMEPQKIAVVSDN